MVVIRLARAGSKKKPFYHVVVTNKTSSRDGRFIQRVGYFNPVARGKDVKLLLDEEAITAWVAKGAQLSSRVKTLVKLHKSVAADEAKVSA